MFRLEDAYASIRTHSPQLVRGSGFTVEQSAALNSLGVFCFINAAPGISPNGGGEPLALITAEVRKLM
ncbi:hypothetical protein ABTC40_19890, partial [Acinetobacter baumannii]